MDMDLDDGMGWDCRLMNDDLKPQKESRIYTCVL